MPYVEMMVDVDLADLETEDLIEELEGRGYQCQDSRVQSANLVDLIPEIIALIDAKVYFPEKFDNMFREFVNRFNGRII